MRKVALESAQDRACASWSASIASGAMSSAAFASRALTQIKSLDTFDFTAQPSLNKPLVLELRLEPARLTSRSPWDLPLVKRYSAIAFTTAAALVHELMDRLSAGATGRAGSEAKGGDHRSPRRLRRRAQEGIQTASGRGYARPLLRSTSRPQALEIKTLSAKWPGIARPRRTRASRSLASKATQANVPRLPQPATASN